MMNHVIRHAAQERPTYCAKSAGANHDKLRLLVIGNLDDCLARATGVLDSHPLSRDLIVWGNICGDQDGGKLGLWLGEALEYIEY